jgi:hypothetical protein
MNDIEQKAIELAQSITKQIEEVNNECLHKMQERGYDPDMYVLETNIAEVIEDPTIAYKCKAVLKPRFMRGENK